MRIAITGHTSGIGQALAKQYEQKGHTIVGLSKRYGDNIRNIPKIIEKVKDCDMFINNAQEGYAQTDLLFEIYKHWEGVPNKYIMIISTMMTLAPKATLDGLDMEHYRNQKVALEEATKILAHRNLWPQICAVKPGEVHTGDHSSSKAVAVDQWAETLVKILELAGPTMKVYEISLGVDYTNES